MKYIFNNIEIQKAVEKSFSFDDVLKHLKYPDCGSLKQRLIKYIKSNNISTIHFSRLRWNRAYYLSVEYKTKISNALKGKSTGKGSTPEKELERRRNISKSMKNNPKAGGLREGSGRGKKMWYESKIAGKVYLRST